MNGVSVLILTFNEEVNIAGCLESCAACDDIVVFDSCSSDQTKPIALSRNARVYERPFDNYAAQRNAALREVRYKHPWVLMLDADERLTPALAAEIERCIANADPELALLRVRRKDFFLGKWIKRSSGYPTWFGRLARIGRVRVEREINEEYIADGRVGHLKEHLLHFPFNKGISHWFERHNRYSTMEAAAKLSMRSAPIEVRMILSPDPTLRRRALKQMLYRVPMRPWIVFLYLYVVRLGVLDGVPGFHFSRMRAAYEMFIDLKVTEAKRRRRGLAV